MTRPELRIGDREREAALTALGEHYAAGRITKDEYDERSAVIWAARTNGQLWPVFADLPGPHQARGAMALGPRTAGPAPWEPPPQARRRPGRGIPILPLVVLVIVATVVLDAWPLLLLIGVLWWFGVLRMVHRTVSRWHSRP